MSSICSLDFIDFIACGCFGARKQSSNQQKQTLNDIQNYWGNRIVSICRELTKIYEETFLGSISESILYFSKSNPKGEFVIMIAKDDKNVYF